MFYQGTSVPGQVQYMGAALESGNSVKEKILFNVA